jgi:glycosyltransferase involved in cell wall biosynthesis
MTLSVVILAKNEEQSIGSCIKSASQLFVGDNALSGEVIIIDDFSSDNTVNLAKNLGAKIYQRRLNSDFSSQRNFGLKKAKGDWVLFLDADELLSTDLTSEIKRKINMPGIDGYFIARQDVFMGKKMQGGDWGKISLMRLGKKDKGRWERWVHEEWRVNGNTSSLTAVLPHSGHKTLSEFVNKLNFYSKIHAESNFKEGKKPSFIKIIIFPLLKFINNFVFKNAYRDGTHGFVYSVFMSFHSFLSWSQLWISKKHKN